MIWVVGAAFAQQSPETSMRELEELTVPDLAGIATVLTTNPSNPTVYASYAEASAHATWPVLYGPDLARHGTSASEHEFFRALALDPRPAALARTLLEAGIAHDPESAEVVFLITGAILAGEHVDGLSVPSSTLEKASSAAARYRQQAGRPVGRWSTSTELANAYASRRWLAHPLGPETRAGLRRLLSATPGVLSRLRAARDRDRVLSGRAGLPNPTSSASETSLFTAEWLSPSTGSQDDHSLRGLRAAANGSMTQARGVAVSDGLKHRFEARRDARFVDPALAPLRITLDPEASEAASSWSIEPMTAHYSMEARWRSWAVSEGLVADPSVNRALTDASRLYEALAIDSKAPESWSDSPVFAEDIRSIQPVGYSADAFSCSAVLGVYTLDVAVHSPEITHYTLLLPLHRTIEVTRLPSESQFRKLIDEGPTLHQVEAALARRPRGCGCEHTSSEIGWLYAGMMVMLSRRRCVAWRCSKR